jgi:hypothetical protein
MSVAGDDESAACDASAAAIRLEGLPAVACKALSLDDVVELTAFI